MCINVIITHHKKVRSVVLIQSNSSNEASQLMQSPEHYKSDVATLKKRIEVTYISPDNRKRFAKSEAITREPNSQGFVLRCYTDC